MHQFRDPLLRFKAHGPLCIGTIFGVPCGVGFGTWLAIITRTTTIGVIDGVLFGLVMTTTRTLNVHRTWVQLGMLKADYSARLDVGRAITFGRPVTDIIAARLAIRIADRAEKHHRVALLSALCAIGVIAQIVFAVLAIRNDQIVAAVICGLFAISLLWALPRINSNYLNMINAGHSAKRLINSASD